MELIEMTIQLKFDLNRFSSGTSKLDKMLGLGQTNKFGLGYEWTYIDRVQKTVDENPKQALPKIQGTSTSHKNKLANKLCHRCGVIRHIKRRWKQGVKKLKHHLLQGDKFQMQKSNRHLDKLKRWRRILQNLIGSDSM